jgi:superfamily I DNA/RNA helicase
MKWTGEQELLLEAVQKPLDDRWSSNVVIYTDSKAGCGKTTMVGEIIRRNPGAKYIYTAFNKKIVQDGIPKFGADNCKTFHALAHKFVSRPNIGGFYPYSVKESSYMTYNHKKEVVDMLDKYCLSKHLAIDDFFDEYAVTDPSIEKLVLKYLELMSERKIPMTFNYMLKELHHQLADGSLRIDLDMLFVDEAQDLTPVMLEIFGLIQSTVKLYLGDTSQDIYSFLDLASAFTLSVDTYDLTTSFRLSPAIAKRIEPFCQSFIDVDFKITGVNTDTSDTTVGYVTHTNAEVILQVAELQNKGKTFSLTKPAKEIFEVAIEVEKALRGTPSKKPKYWKLNELRDRGYGLKVLANSEQLDDDIISSLKLIEHLTHKRVDIMAVLNLAEKTKPNPNCLIGTAHSVKGLEFGTVYISNGLNKFVDRLLKSYPRTQDETAEIIEGCKLYYVACSRAKHTLNNAVMLDYINKYK